jgi:hypothetical protein
MHTLTLASACRHARIYMWAKATNQESEKFRHRASKPGPSTLTSQTIADVGDYSVLRMSPRPFFGRIWAWGWQGDAQPTLVGPPDIDANVDSVCL